MDFKKFLMDNPDEFVVVYIDNKAVGNDIMPEFKNVTESIFGRDMIFTPQDVEDQNNLGSWPTVGELVSKGKQIAFENNRGSWEGTIADETFWTPTLWSGSRGGTQFGPGSFNEFPECTVGSTFFYGRGQSRFFDGSINLGEAFNRLPTSGIWGSRGNRELDRQELTDMADCGIARYDMDQLEPEDMQHFVWSWDRDQPKADEGSCTYMGANGRWASGDCSATKLFACATASTQGGSVEWLLQETGVTFAQAASSCQEGTTFELPRDGYQNSKLADLANGQDVWVNYRIECPYGGSSVSQCVAACPASTKDAANSCAERCKRLCKS